MRITVSIDSRSLEELKKITRAKKKSQAISRAIEAFLKERKIELLLSLRGKLPIEDNRKQMKALELKKLARLARFG